ncbi:cupin domain-containing protein [Blastococcus jejuensis]|uniref:Cupin domain-containing protein n=1 Tax=Blastococcus jejuensis TaxID=351224 RepID=A0ABP6NUI6_9ACTN
MPVFRAPDAQTFETHGSRFTAYVAPSRGSRELCSWRLDVPPGLIGAPHRPSREEVLLVLAGSLEVTLDGERAQVCAGDVVLVPADAELQVDGGPAGAAAWVTTTPGLEARLPDGSTIAPPWAS